MTEIASLIQHLLLGKNYLFLIILLLWGTVVLHIYYMIHKYSDKLVIFINMHVGLEML